MNDYSKWEQLEDSEDEKIEKAEQEQEKARAEYQEECRAEQAEVEKWLRRYQTLLVKAEAEPSQARPRDPYAPPELIKNSQQPFRKASRDDLRVLSMLMVLSHFEEGGTNLTRHPQLLDLVRHNRWLEEDPGAMELLCRVHNYHMKQAEDKGRAPTAPEQEKLEQRFRSMCLSAINTLAAASKAGCPGGLLEVVNLICTPTTKSAKELRVKWQQKEFGKDALFDSLFPDLKQFKEEYDSKGGWWEVWLMLGFIVLLFVGLGALMYLTAPLSKQSTVTTTTTLLTTTLAAAGDSNAEL